MKPDKHKNKILLLVENSQVADLATNLVLILNHFTYCQFQKSVPCNYNGRSHYATTEKIKHLCFLANTKDRCFFYQRQLCLILLPLPPLQGPSLVAQMVKNLYAMQETLVPSPCQEDPLEKGMATHTSILAWKIPRTEEPGGLQSMGSQRVGHN